MANLIGSLVFDLYVPDHNQRLAQLKFGVFAEEIYLLFNSVISCTIKRENSDPRKSTRCSLFYHKHAVCMKSILTSSDGSSGPPNVLDCGLCDFGANLSQVYLVVGQF